MVEFLRNRIALAPFVMIWGLYFVLLAITGFSSAYDDLHRAIVYQAIFVAVVCLPVLFLKTAEQREPKTPGRSGNIVLVMGLVIGAVALASLFTDRMLQGIDYSHGACVARWQMTRLGMHRIGVSSPFSVVGQLFGYAYFVPAVLVVTQQVSRKIFWIVMSFAFAILMLQAEVAASRTPIMLFGMFIVAAVCIRIAAKRSIPRIKLVDVVMTVLFGLIAVGFVLSVFSCRAAASHMTTTQYAQEFTSFLGAENAATPRTSEKSSYIGGLYDITALYATHSAFTFAGIISMPDDGGSMTLNGPISLLRHIGINIDEGDENAKLTGRFPSMPGALYHDIGLIGMIVGGLLLGCAIWASGWLVIQFGGSVISIGIACAVYAIAYVSPLVLATNFMAFPFICFGFLAVATISGLVSSVS